LCLTSTRSLLYPRRYAGWRFKKMWVMVRTETVEESLDIETSLIAYYKQTHPRLCLNKIGGGGGAIGLAPGFVYVSVCTAWGALWEG
jgi:hypothetical protein